MPSSSITPGPADYEPLEPALYELTWMSGHVERIAAHDVSYANGRVVFLADADGRMRIQLSTLEEDLRTIRNVTEDEVLLLPEGGEPA
ncbi:hypothetical protein O3Q52_17300 [Streptomyces sp. ActVer]|uniref:hypothetical protein n=1 Tax=Streptomyces sp. ActVer TaxID=3014558 RepID=UPI0022B37727|nr:hypothetical protein [Streptomyces sp. ActVer]MCZ4509921.1 hypothetical protein [Streptomyces sp. ActVer]